VSPPAWPLQVAIRGVLIADLDLMSLITGVYDHVPPAAVHPYVVVGDCVDRPDDAHDRRGWDSMATLHIWSRYRGTGQALQILGHLDRLLHRRPLVVPGYTDISIAHDWHQTMRDPDPEVRHVPVRYRVWLAEEP